MTPVSRRYVPHLLVVMAPTLMAVLVHSYKGLSVDDCRQPLVLFLNDDHTAARAARDAWMRETFHATEWAEGSFTTEGREGDFGFVIIRSYDPKKLYHRPEHRLAKVTAARRTIESVTSGAETLPIHVIEYRQGEQPQMAAYLLVYNSRPVANPYWAQLAAIPGQLLTGARPMTLFFISGGGAPVERTAIKDRAKMWLADAWRRYQVACRAAETAR